MEFTVEAIARSFPVTVHLGIKELDVEARVVFEMYARNVCQQLEWNNGETATDYAEDGANRLLLKRSLAGVVGAGVLFGICIAQQLEWGNGEYATDVALLAGKTILPKTGDEGVEICQKLFNICIEQQLSWGNGAYAKEITEKFSDLIARKGR